MGDKSIFEQTIRARPSLIKWLFDAQSEHVVGFALLKFRGFLHWTELYSNDVLDMCIRVPSMVFAHFISAQLSVHDVFRLSYSFKDVLYLLIMSYTHY